MLGVAAKIPVPMQEKRVLTLSVCPIVSAKIECGNIFEKNYAWRML